MSEPADLAGAPAGRPTLKRVRSRSSSVNKIPTSQPGRLPRQGALRIGASSMDRLVYYAREHTWFGPLCVILAALFLYGLQPTQENPVSRFLFVSYPIRGSTPQVYGKGYWDLAFVGFYVVVFTFTREFCMQFILAPVARFYGLRKGKVQRFMEQGYTIMYFSCSASFGIWVMSRTSMWYFNTRQFYADYPHQLHEADFKVYYLAQFAYWLQQFIVLALQLEKPRKDYHELIIHHIVTLLLIGLSYIFHFTWIGLAVFITMDSSDVFLALSKNLNYIDSVLTGPFFIFFVGVWFYTRHWLSGKILYSVVTEFETVGPWEVDWDKGLYKCWISQYVCFALLAAIYALNVYWFFLILRILYRFVFQNEARDERSDDEDEDDEEPPADAAHKKKNK
ncbi:sphingosine N-acyltransferase lag1 [Savitreella phatthalungensis]